MKYQFKARIYKVGINPCVKVPLEITARMSPVKGYIRVKGKIEKHNFLQTLVPVKDAEYRLYVNGLMLKGANVKLGDIVKFSIEQDFTPRERSYPMLAALRKELRVHKLTKVFKSLTAWRQMEILRYLHYLKTEEARKRNIDKVIKQLMKGEF
jgi:hypothetical protein